MMRRIAFSLVALLVLSVPAGPVQGQDGPEFTLESIHASATLRASTFQGGKWADQGPVITYIEAADSADATHLMRYNLRTDEQTRVIDGTTLYADDVDRVVPIEDYTLGPAGDKVLIYTDSKEVWRANTKGYYYVYDLDAQTLTPVSDRDRGTRCLRSSARRPRRWPSSGTETCTS
jgi:dipeptidyl-peptidase IV (EC:3.4.14.5). Serine peptidase. MEROPS family S09B